ncbi:hypothetical protein Neosp_013535 [[Neocosmospora] mangrovei]
MTHNIWAIPLQLTNFNLVVAVLGGFISLFGLVSYLLKENYYLSEAQWKAVFLLVGPGMTAMWLATSVLVWGFTGRPSFLHALAVGACVTPTDPVLSAVIVKGKFADHNIPKDLQNLIVAESGTNDGLGYPFLFFALYLIKYVGSGATSGGAGDAMGLWFGFTWGYTIILSVIYGAVVGWVAKEMLHWAEERNYVDRESFLVFAISLALFVLGTCGLIGTDDVLACFIAGNTFTWDDWFRLETKDDSLQPTIDMLLNVTIFLWYGAVIPWELFNENSVMPIWKLVVLGILVLILRRLPWVFAMHKWIPQIEEAKQAVFVGFFGPIGVSAIFYLFISLEFIQEHLSDGEDRPREDVQKLGETIRIVVWFLAVCSVVVHGLSIPLGKLGYLAPRTLSRVMSENMSDDARVVERRRKVPLIGSWLAGLSKGEPEPRPIRGPIVITSARPIRATPANRIDVSGTSTPRRDREIRFPDEIA